MNSVLTTHQLLLDMVAGSSAAGEAVRTLPYKQVCVHATGQGGVPSRWRGRCPAKSQL